MEIYPVTPVLLGVILRFLIVQYFSTLKFLSCSWIIEFLYVCNYISFLDLMLFIIFLFKPKSISLDFYNNHPLVLLILFRLLMFLKVIVLYFYHNFKKFSPQCFLRVSFSSTIFINRCWTTECIQIFILFSSSLNFSFNHLSSHSVCHSLSNLFQQMV